MSTLTDYGERKLIESIVSRYCTSIGDDCAVLSIGSEDLVVTTDPVPQPAAFLIGGDPDPYWAGWLLVIINASDLAAAAAKPVGFLAAVEAPADTNVRDFERFLRGVSEACVAEGLQYAGGNLREGPRLLAVGTAFGTCAQGRALRRIGASAGDILVSVGRGGRFWDDALALRAGIRDVSKTSSPLFRPRSQSHVMRLLAAEGAISACMDNSDGLLPSMNELARQNQLQAILHLDDLPLPSAGPYGCDDPVRLWLGWGDWNVVAAISPKKITVAEAIVGTVNGELIRLGVFESGPAGVFIERNGQRAVAPRLESERFAADSWFSSGIEGYIDLLLKIPIPTPTRL